MRGEQLLGAWTLDSYVKLCDGRIVGYPLGETPRGQILYTPDGRMSAFLQNGIAPPLVAYAGEWTLDGDVVTHHLAFNYESERVGDKVERAARLEDGALILQTPKKQTKDGTVWLELRWVRPA